MIRTLRSIGLRSPTAFHQWHLRPRQIQNSYSRVHRVTNTVFREFLSGLAGTGGWANVGILNRTKHHPTIGNLISKYLKHIPHRIHGAGIYANIGGILMVNVTIYSSTISNSLMRTTRDFKFFGPTILPTQNCLTGVDCSYNYCVVVWNMFYLSTIYGIIPFQLTNHIFQRGWNHQPVYFSHGSKYKNLTAATSEPHADQMGFIPCIAAIFFLVISYELFSYLI